MNKIKIAMADDHKLFRSGMVALLRDEEDIEVIYEAGDGAALLQKMEFDLPEVVLLDLNMPVMDGIETTKAIRAKFSGVHIIILSMHDESSYVVHMMQLGANAYLLKNTDPDEVVRAIRTVCLEEFYLNEFVNRAMLQEYSKRGFKQYDGVTLITREVEVLRFLCLEYPVKKIAEELHLSPRTIEGVKLKLFDKTSSKTYAGLVLFALKNNIIREVDLVKAGGS